MSDLSRGTWTLHRRPGGEVVAAIVVESAEFPWLSGRLEPNDGFAGVRHLFDDDLRTLADIEQDVDAADRAYQAIRDAVTLRYPDGRDVPEFLLHIDGDEAWWRWNDEPFEA